MNETESLFCQIPLNAKVCIWGAANAGVTILEELNNLRKDVEVIAFIDSFKKGNVNNIKIYSPEDIGIIKERIDFMLISTRSDATVIDAVLFYYDIKNSARISQSLLKKYQFIPSQVQKVMDILDDEEDRSLLQKVINGRITGDTSELRKYAEERHNIAPDRKRTIKHYTSYINYDAIETILEGGMFNGLNTVIFKKLFKNLKKIYAFELIYENVKNKSLDHIIRSMKELEIVDYAMWEKRGKLQFTHNTKEPYSSGINPSWNKNDSEVKYEVDCISIDEFIKERGIPKVDFIKMDIEGAELPALRGAKDCLIKLRPQLAISIYHSSYDILNIPLYIDGMLKNYIYKIGHYSPDNDETILYAIPEELYEKRG